MGISSHAEMKNKTMYKCDMQNTRRDEDQVRKSADLGRYTNHKPFGMIIVLKKFLLCQKLSIATINTLIVSHLFRMDKCTKMIKVSF